ncbi:MAG: uracil phosphoribosyltransferase [Crocinitomicaceae bacterium]
MSSSDFFYGLKDGIYWLFENTLEPLADLPWQGVLIFGFIAFAYWMKRQIDYNKIAENDSDQIK